MFNSCGSHSIKKKKWSENSLVTHDFACRWPTLAGRDNTPPLSPIPTSELTVLDLNKCQVVRWRLLASLVSINTIFVNFYILPCRLWIHYRYIFFQGKHCNFLQPQLILSKVTSSYWLIFQLPPLPLSLIKIIYQFHSIPSVLRSYSNVICFAPALTPRYRYSLHVPTHSSPWVGYYTGCFVNTCHKSVGVFLRHTVTKDQYYYSMTTIVS